MVQGDQSSRNEPFHPEPPPTNRTPAQRDRDRILYEYSFRRLGGVTQVVLAREGHLFHNRLTHSLKVAQVGRRIAETISKQAAGQTEEEAAIEVAGGLDPDVVEAAGLAHDLGHPPFGHVGEQELNLKVQRWGDTDGFEGNPQTFRILTRLATRSHEYPGLNLSRATLNAVLKYPWLRAIGDKKWGAYVGEEPVFEWARAPLGLGAEVKTLEAQVMDWADDITYAVHDVEDFYRAGFIPLPELSQLHAEQFPLEAIVRTAWETSKLGAFDRDLFRDAVNATVRYFPLEGAFTGVTSQRIALHDFGSNLIGRFVGATDVEGGRLRVPNEIRMQVEVLKSLTRAHVFENPSLATQQEGERQIVRELFDMYWDALGRGRSSLFPARLQEEVGDVAQVDAARFVADTIATMTEDEAVRIHQRMLGTSLGTLVDPSLS